MSDYIILACPNCGAKTSVREDTGQIQCDYCGTTMVLRGTPAAANLSRAANPAPPAGEIRPMAPTPSGVRIDTLPDGIQITRRWFNATHIFLAVFAVFWNAFLLFFFGVAFRMGAPSLFVLFPLLFVAIGVYIAYTALTGFVNSSVIRVTHTEFSVQHGPLPWPGALNLPAAELTQLYTQEVLHRSKNGTTRTYTLSAVLSGGRKLDLLSGLPSSDTGYYIEEQVEKYLGISDRPVKGEAR